MQNVVRFIEDVAGVFEYDEAQIVFHKRQRDRRQAQLKAGQEHAATAERRAGHKIAWTGAIDGESAMRIAAARKEALRQRNRARTSVGRRQADARGARKHELALAELLV